jgi:hypothetical protein
MNTVAGPGWKGAGLQIRGTKVGSSILPRNSTKRICCAGLLGEGRCPFKAEKRVRNPCAVPKTCLYTSAPSGRWGRTFNPIAKAHRGFESHLVYQQVLLWSCSSIGRASSR